MQTSKKALTPTDKTYICTDWLQTTIETFSETPSQRLMKKQTRTLGQKSEQRMYQVCKIDRYIRQDRDEWHR